MIRKFLVAFAVFALVVAFAGGVPGPGTSYRITLLQPSSVKGGDLKAGEYKVSLGMDKATFQMGKVSVEAPVKVETGTDKFRNTTIRYTNENGKSVISEIRVGGTSTRLIFN